MAKKVLLDVLEKTIGKYVVNLDTNSLSVAVWSGKIELSSLQLNVDAVNAELATIQPPIPFRVKSGHFHSFQVDVPWTNLMGKSVVLRAKGLSVQVEPKDKQQNTTTTTANDTRNADLPSEIMDARREAVGHADEYRLQASALRQLAQQDLATETSGSQSSSFSATLVRRIVENMQIEISNVHISLESPDSSAGACLESLKLVTTDEKGNRTFVDRNPSKDSFLYKSLQIHGLAIYLDEQSSSNNQQGKLATRPLSSIQEADENNDATSEPQHSYVLAPLSFQAKLRQADSNVCLDHPKYLLSSDLASLSVLLSKTQVELAYKIGEMLAPDPSLEYERTHPLLFPEYRPLVRLGTGDKTAARQWWQYAFRCVGRMNGQRSWVEFHRAFLKRKQYIPLYKRKAHAPRGAPASASPKKSSPSKSSSNEQAECHWIKPLSEAEEETLAGLEQDRSISVQGIMIWRDMADAQVRLEKEKHAAKAAAVKPKSMFTSIFGSSNSAKSESNDGEEPPIVLSAEEMKELETATMAVAESEVLSKESKLYDVQFVLKSFQISLMSYNYSSLAVLSMGTAATSFSANADGSYHFDFALASLSIEDKITPNSLFGTVLKNQVTAADQKAFSLQLDKSKQGDQALQVHLSTFEAIASPTLFRELKRFVANHQVGPPVDKLKANPILAQSLSGSVDLFYDAAEGPPPPTTRERLGDSAFGHPPIRQTESHEATPTAVDSLSNALFDAWKVRTENRSNWSMDLNISAPIVVIPESCTDPSANVLVFDLGHFQFTYGRQMPESSVSIKRWFKANPKFATKMSQEPTVDYGSLEISSLTFMIGKNDDWRRLVKKHQNLESSDEKHAVIEPISIHLRLGVEVAANSRICTQGVLPSIILAVSPEQLANMLAVYKTWMKVLNDMSSQSTAGNRTLDDSASVSNASVSSAGSRLLEQARKAASVTAAPEDASTEVTLPKYKRFHVDVQLQRFSVKVGTGDGHGMQAHLVFVGASMDLLSNSTSQTRLTMGWFWILDNLENSFPREQRLLAHSRLPVEEPDQIMQALEDLGAFTSSFAGSSDLADVTMVHSPDSLLGSIEPFSDEASSSDDLAANTIVLASLSSLFVNWNPRAVKNITSALSTFSDLVNQTLSPDRGSTVILLAPEDAMRPAGEVPTKAVPGENISANTCTVLRARMESVQVCLRSARDDLPLFTLTMASTNASITSKAKDGMIFRSTLGNLSIVTPEMGGTHEQYHTVLGLAPCKADSLMSIRYIEGKNAMGFEKDDSLRRSIRMDAGNELGAWALVTISPMRMVHIQSQVLALVEYATEGILGAIASQAASTAAVAAAEMASSGSEKKLFVVRATGFEVLLPEKATEKEFFSVQTGELSAEYTALPELGGRATISLKDVMMRDFSGNEMQDDPIHMGIDIVLPPEGVGTEDDQAYRIKLDMSNAALLVTKNQYRQILSTLDKNIGEMDLFLRDEGPPAPVVEDPEASIQNTISVESSNLTHAGVAQEVKARSMVIDVTIHSMSLSLRGETENDGIALVRAVRTVVHMVTKPSEEMISTTISLQELVCVDERPSAIGRSERDLISQDTKTKQADHFFIVSYEKKGDSEMKVGLKVGSPRVVFIPDAIMEVLGFVSTEQGGAESSTAAISSVAETSAVDYKITPIADGTAIEVSAYSVPSNMRSMVFSLSTGPCSVVLVDLGGNSLVGELGSNSRVSGSSMAETIVMRGSFDAKSSMKSDGASNAIVDVDAQIHGDGFEVFTAYGTNLSPMQVVEPFQFSVYGHGRNLDDVDRTVDLRMAVISPIDMSFSMRNYALLNAILSSIEECVEERTARTRDEEIQAQPLSSQSVRHIEHLSQELQGQSEDLPSSHSTSSDSTTSAVYSGGEMDSAKITSRLKLSLKITLPQARWTIINDLQGLDDALLRVEVQNMITNVQVREGERLKPGARPFTAFDATVNGSISADYFDTAETRWRDFLLKPWEITVRTARGPNRKMISNRPSTSLDIESFPCHVAFSEEFLMSVASANRMWGIYSTTTSKLLQSVQSSSASAQSSFRRSIAATAARTLVTALPYALENNTGLDLEFKVFGSESTKLRSCTNGRVEFFRFPPPKSSGFGAKRVYGQDVTFEKTVSIRVLNSWIEIESVDSQVGGSRRHHEIEESLVLFTEVVKQERTTVVRISSGVDINCKVSVPVSLVMSSPPNGEQVVGVLGVSSTSAAQSAQTSSVLPDGGMSKASSKFGLPADHVKAHREEWRKLGSTTMVMMVEPDVSEYIADVRLSGAIRFTLDQQSIYGSETKLLWRNDVVCRPLPQLGSSNPTADAFVLHARIFGQLVGGQHVNIDMILEPRALVDNKLPIPITIRTPMPHTYSRNSTSDDSGSSFHHLEPNTAVEVYTVGPSIAVSVKCTDKPVGGTPTSWVEGEWVDLPLTADFRLPEPLRCNFPFTSYSGASYDGLGGGPEFYIVDGVEALAGLGQWAASNKADAQAIASGMELAIPSDGETHQRMFSITVCHYSVDQTGEILFSSAKNETARKFAPKMSMKRRGKDSSTSSATGDGTPLGAYRSRRNRGRVSLLPSSNDKIQLIHLNMEGEYGIRKSRPFTIEDVSISDGGVNSTPVLWEDGQPAGFFLFQTLINSYQSEIHVVPEYIVFNGSKNYFVRVRQPKGVDVVIGPGGIGALRTCAGQAATISLEWIEFDGLAAPISVDKLGLRVAIVRRSDGAAIGSVAIQTVVGGVDSRLVVKLGDIRLGSEARRQLTPESGPNSLEEDFVRARIQWSELRVTLNEGRPIVDRKKAYLESALDRVASDQGVTPSARYNDGQTSTIGQTWVEARDARSNSLLDRDEQKRDAVCSLILSQFTVDYQRVFKEDAKHATTQSEKERLQSLERSQLSIIIHNIRITDDTPNSRIPVVLDSTTSSNFFDLCIRCKGPLDSELVKVDLFDLNLANTNGKSQRIVLSTTEDFAWKILDLGDRILAAAGELHGVDISLKWDEEQEAYTVEVRDTGAGIGVDADEEESSNYTPPNSEQLFDIARARVSAFCLLASFERTPHAARMSPAKSGQYKALMNYFTQRLKFKIDRADLKFAKYEATNIRGPADRIIEIISTVYMSRMKLQFVTLMSAISVQDWKFLADRSGGDDEFMDGDLVRAAGNLAGNTVNYVFKRSGRGVESAFKRGSSNLGETIESAASKVGAEKVGASVNSMVSGVGGGVGEAVGGVGQGAGKVLKGAGQGVGHVIGGVTGGASTMAKGIHKSIKTGDGGKAMVSGVADGVKSVGVGVGQGVSSVVTGTADGVFTVGKGLFTGVRSVGKGMVGAIRMKKGARSNEASSDDSSGQKLPSQRKGGYN